MNDQMRNIPAELRLMIIENRKIIITLTASLGAINKVLQNKNIITDEEFSKEYEKMIDGIDMKSYDDAIETLEKEIKQTQIIEKIIKEGKKSLSDEEKTAYDEIVKNMSEEERKLVESTEFFGKLFKGDG